jgi:hypothetical protein
MAANHNRKYSIVDKRVDFIHSFFLTIGIEFVLQNYFLKY